MSNNGEQPAAEGVPAPSSLVPVPFPGVANLHDLTAELKQRLAETRLPANLKERILAQLPAPEEREQLFRELQEKGGLSSEQFFVSLGLPEQPE